MLFREPWRTRLLFASFALNLFLLALIGAHAALRPHAGPPLPERMVEQMAHSLPDAEAERFRVTMGARLPEILAGHARMEAARAEVAAAIARDPYDPAAVRTAMQTWQADWLAMSRSIGDGMLSALPALSPDGRRRLADAGLRRPRP